MENPTKIPIRKQPIRFTVNVPYGKPELDCSCKSMEKMYLSEDPMAPPSATHNNTPALIIMKPS